MMTQNGSTVNGSDETMNTVEGVILMIEKVIHHTAN
jgi:hypothetical protein